LQILVFVHTIVSAGKDSKNGKCGKSIKKKESVGKANQPLMRQSPCHDFTTSFFNTYKSSSYGDMTNNAISGFAYPGVKYFQLVAVCKYNNYTYDCIYSATFCDASGYLNSLYQAAHRNNNVTTVS
jgi:hypothetical protein